MKKLFLKYKLTGLAMALVGVIFILNIVFDHWLSALTNLVIIAVLFVIMKLTDENDSLRNDNDRLRQHCHDLESILEGRH